MRLADELRGAGIRRPFNKMGVSRRNICADDHTLDPAIEAKRRRAREVHAQWRKKNPDKVRAMRGRDAERHPDRIKRNKQEWRKKNRAHVRAYNARMMRKWRRERPELANAAKKRWYDANRDAINARRRATRAANLEAAKAQRREYDAARRASA